MEEFLDLDREVKMVLTVQIKDVFIKLEDITEFIKFRLNLKKCCHIKELMIVEDSTNPCNLLKSEVLK